MTPNDFVGFSLVLLFFSYCWTVSHSQMLSNCCLSVSGEKMPIRAPLVDYDRQVAGSGCPIDAIVGGAKLCIATDAPGVRRAMRRVDRLKKVCRNKNYGGDVNEKMLKENHFPN